MSPTHAPPGSLVEHRQPRLGQVIRDAEHYAAQLLAVLKRDYDPASAPSTAGDWLGATYVDVRLMCAKADVISALRMLAEITELGLPPAGSAVKYPARQAASSVPAPGGPSSHPVHVPGEGRTSGLVVPAAAPVAVGVDGSLGGSPRPEAGASSGTRPVVSGPGAGHDPERPTSPGLPPRPGERDLIEAR